MIIQSKIIKDAFNLSLRQLHLTIIYVLLHSYTSINRLLEYNNIISIMVYHYLNLMFVGLGFLLIPGVLFLLYWKSINPNNRLSFKSYIEAEKKYIGVYFKTAIWLELFAIMFYIPYFVYVIFDSSPLASPYSMQTLIFTVMNMVFITIFSIFTFLVLPAIYSKNKTGLPAVFFSFSFVRKNIKSIKIFIWVIVFKYGLEIVLIFARFIYGYSQIYWFFNFILHIFDRYIDVILFLIGVQVLGNPFFRAEQINNE